MDPAPAGAMGNIARYVFQLLQDEYKLQEDVKAQVKSLAKELKAMDVALCKVAQVPHDQLDPQVKLWANEAREAAYDMEDILDTFPLRCHPSSTRINKGNFRRLLEKARTFLSLSRFLARHEIAGAIKDIKIQVDEMTQRLHRHRIDNIVVSSAVTSSLKKNYASTTSIDPRILMTLRTKASELVGINEPRDELIKMLTRDEGKEMKIVSVVGAGGLGKTTLVKIVYEKLTADLKIYYKAFVPVGWNPDLKKALRDILLGLNKTRYMRKINFATLDESQLIEEIQAFLKHKRYFIVIDDVWDLSSLTAISTALEDNKLGSKIMITTRCNDVAKQVHCTYKMVPLPLDSSKILFYGRIFGSQNQCPEMFSELSEKILKKCGGVPLAIISIASLLANKSNDDISEWQEVWSSIGAGHRSNDDMTKILSLSYYDLPYHMKPCFLYVGMYPEDCEIDRDQLIWKWISEGFIHSQKKGDDLFELGKSYFNDLINRSLVQPVESKYDITACRVHDMILDLICSLSREENFVTTSYDIEQMISTESRKRPRRLSLNSITTWPQKGIAQVRSLAVFGSSMNSMPSFSGFDMLRVLDLQGCSLQNFEGSKLYVGNLIHLRYLGLRGTSLDVVPEGIEKLQFLQVLKMDQESGGVELPESIFGLRRLMCLEGVFCCPCPGKLLKNLASLQVLDTLYLDKDATGIVEALGHLTQLRVLVIKSWSTTRIDWSTIEALTNSMGSLRRLQCLNIQPWAQSNSLIKWERWMPPPQLREVRDIFSGALPKWINHALLPNLVEIAIKVCSVQLKDIQILGTLPSLMVLRLRADPKNYVEQPVQKFMVQTGAFPCLRTCYFDCVATVPSMSRGGAMLRVEEIRFCIRAWDFVKTYEPFCEDAGGLLNFDDLAMDHLPSLRYVSCSINTTRISSDDFDETRHCQVTELKAALKQAVDVHPNHPYLSLH